MEGQQQRFESAYSEMSLPGQFEDADADPLEDDEVFLSLMRNRLALQPPLPSSSRQQATDDETKEVEAQQIFDDDDDDDDYEEMGEGYDDDDLMMDDFLLNVGTSSMPSSSSSHHTKAASAAASGSTSSKRMNLSHATHNAVIKMENLETTKRASHTGKDERATTEQCLDPRTRLILFRLLSSGFLEVIDGCLSTGKEANVYYAKRGATSFSQTFSVSLPSDYDEVTEYAIKIYKTSILVFKDRDKYVAGEHRWRHGYCKSNPRKMVKVWAEKELRNYRRLWAAGIPCPAPMYLKSHVLIMEFLGTNQWPSPRFKDAKILSSSSKLLAQAHIETMLIMRRMYQRCKLVHGDLSEYNLLWHKSRVFVIDVSQSVETSHPIALELLRVDCANINDYFSKMAPQMPVLTNRQLFEFVTSPLPPSTTAAATTSPLTQEEEEQAELLFLNQLLQQVTDEETRLQKVSEQARRDHVHKEEVEEAVFMSQYIPRSLNQVGEYEMAQMEEGQMDESYAKAVAAMTGGNAQQQPVAPAVIHKRQHVDDKQQQNKSVKKNLAVENNFKNDTDASNKSPAEGTVEPSNVTVDNVEARKEDDDLQDDLDDKDENPEDDSSSSDSESDDDDDDDKPFVKVPRTTDQLLAEKDEVRAMRKANKKSVKEERSQKRITKLKKKDKKMAIKKTKSGNRKNK